MENYTARPLIKKGVREGFWAVPKSKEGKSSHPQLTSEMACKIQLDRSRMNKRTQWAMQTNFQGWIWLWTLMNTAISRKRWLSINLSLKQLSKICNSSPKDSPSLSTLHSSISSPTLRNLRTWPRSWKTRIRWLSLWSFSLTPPTRSCVICALKWTPLTMRQLSLKRPNA